MTDKQFEFPCLTLHFKADNSRVCVKTATHYKLMRKCS